MTFQKEMILVISAVFFGAVWMYGETQSSLVRQSSQSHDDHSHDDHQAHDHLRRFRHVFTLSHRYRHLLYEVCLDASGWCIVMVTIIHANALQHKFGWSDAFKEIIEAIVTSGVFVVVMIAIYTFSSPRVGRGLAGSIGVVAGFGWENAFHMAQHALHFRTFVTFLI